jgi:hypothetical protein
MQIPSFLLLVIPSVELRASHLLGSHSLSLMVDFIKTTKEKEKLKHINVFLRVTKTFSWQHFLNYD